MNSYEKYIKNNPWMVSFNQLRQRCNNVNHPAYKYYGGRGIKALITKEEIKRLWLAFGACNMKIPSIDRINNNGNYELNNCQFIERTENVVKDRRKPVLQYDLEGNFIKRYVSISEAGRQTNTQHSTICCVVNNARKRQTAGGFVWKLENKYIVGE